MILDADGRKILRPGRSQGEFEKGRDQALEFLATLKEAETGDEKAKIKAFKMKLELEWLSLEEARAELATFKKVSSKDRKAIDLLLVETEVRDLAKEAGKDLAKRRQAGARCAELWAEKQQPEDVYRLIEFWGLLADHCEAQRDKKLMKKVVKAADKTVKKNPRGRQLVKDLEQRYKNM